MSLTIPNYIAGQKVGSSDGRTSRQQNPADLQETTAVFPAATADDARKAIAAAQEAFGPWSRLSPFRRAEFLKNALARMIQRRDEIALAITRENGKTPAESRIEIDAAIREMEYQIHQGVRLGGQTVPSATDGVLAYSVRVPLGVASVISPWNFPFNVPVRKITPALMAGNTVVFKPASLTPRTGWLFTELYVEAGLPPGVLNFVTGGGSTVGEELVTNPLVKAISFTGSTSVGVGIHRRASANLVRTQLEMGGKNPLVVLEDADLEAAARSAVAAAYACAGQWCTSTSRVVVVRQIAAEFLSRIVALAGELRVGPGDRPGVTMGPVCGTEQLNTILRYIETGRQEGARLALGGRRLTDGGLDRGCFIEPTVFAEVKSAMTIAREEIFGPVLSVMEVADFDEAVDVANGVEFGLCSSIYTSSLQRALTFMERTHVGLTHVNMMTSLKEPQLSFGGVKASGFGIPEGGNTGLEFFTEHKVAYVKYR